MQERLRNCVSMTSSNTSLANSIRRVVMADIPTLGTFMVDLLGYALGNAEFALCSH